MSALLAVSDLRVVFGSAPVVDGVGFELAPGEALGIVGESGSGKSMTCRAALGLLPPAARVSGSVRLDGAELLAPDGEAMAAARGRRMSMIFQVPASHLDPLMRVGDQVAEALVRHRGTPRAEARRRAVALLADMRIPDPERWARAYPHELSGGMKQRAMIAGALACDPDVLLADEPTTALDVTVQKEILTLLARLGRERGLAVVLVSHDLGAVASICDRVLVMRAGRIVERGPTPRVVGAPRHPYTRALVDAHPTRLGRAARAPSPSAPPRIEARGITVRYGRRNLSDLLRGRLGGFDAVRDASLALGPGEALGIVGESGSGKSTLARALVGLVRPLAGEIRHDGRPVRPDGPERANYLRRVQLVYQHPSEALSPRLTAREAIAEPLRRLGLCPPGEVGARVERLMAQVDLAPDLASRRPAALSGGQCQRVAIARALAMEPEVLIADEVTSALDVTVQAQVLALLQRLGRETGMSMIFISHDLGVVRHLCDRVLVMHRGRVVEEGPTEQVLDAPREPYTRRLVASIPVLPAQEAAA